MVLHFTSNLTKVELFFGGTGTFSRNVASDILLTAFSTVATSRSIHDGNSSNGMVVFRFLCCRFSAVAVANAVSALESG